MKKYCVVAALFLSHNVRCQDSVFARHVVDTLTSPTFWGRGYTKEGMHKAAEYLSGEFKNYGLTPLTTEGYYQEFSYPVNTFPGRMEVSINDRTLKPGVDYIVSPDSKGIHARGILKQADSTHFVNKNYRFIVAFEDKLTWSVAPKAADYTSISIDKTALGWTIFIAGLYTQVFIGATLCRSRGSFSVAVK